MSISYVQSAAVLNNAVATSISKQFASPVSDDNSLFAFVWTNQTTSCSVADDVNGAYTQIGSLFVGSGLNVSWSLAAFWLKGTQVGTPTVTATIPSNPFQTIAIGEYASVGDIEDFTFGNSGLIASPAIAPQKRTWNKNDMIISIIMPNNSVTAIASPYNTRQIANFGSGAYGDYMMGGMGLAPAMSAALNNTSDNAMMTMVLSSLYPINPTLTSRMPLA